MNLASPPGSKGVGGLVFDNPVAQYYEPYEDVLSPSGETHPARRAEAARLKLRRACFEFRLNGDRQTFPSIDLPSFGLG
jgi:hypothetical protein